MAAATTFLVAGGDYYWRRDRKVMAALYSALGVFASAVVGIGQARNQGLQILPMYILFFALDMFVFLAFWRRIAHRHFAWMEACRWGHRNHTPLASGAHLSGTGPAA